MQFLRLNKKTFRVKNTQWEVAAAVTAFYFCTSFTENKFFLSFSWYVVDFVEETSGILISLGLVKELLGIWGLILFRIESKLIGNENFVQNQSLETPTKETNVIFS